MLLVCLIDSLIDFCITYLNLSNSLSTGADLDLQSFNGAGRLARSRALVRTWQLLLSVEPAPIISIPEGFEHPINPAVCRTDAAAVFWWLSWCAGGRRER